MGRRPAGRLLPAQRPGVAVRVPGGLEFGPLVQSGLLRLQLLLLPVRLLTLLVEEGRPRSVCSSGATTMLRMTATTIAA